jgi:hypothetical protein
MSVCVYCVFVLSCVKVAALRRAHPPSNESNRPSKITKTEMKQAFHGCRTLQVGAAGINVEDKLNDSSNYMFSS